MQNMETMTLQQKKDIRVIAKFVEVYCNGKHSEIDKALMTLPEDLGNRQFCKNCTEFMEYAIKRRLSCPLEAQKPTCKHCRIHCYNSTNREKVKEIMSYSGRKLMMMGRVDYLWHYFF